MGIVSILYGQGAGSITCDRAIVFLVHAIYQDLLASGGVPLFTNMAQGNPWRLLMEYGSD